MATILEKSNFLEIELLGFRVKDLKNEKSVGFRIWKSQKSQKNENFERKSKMSHGQNVVFGISGNLAKLVFSKISPAGLDIWNQLAFYFCSPIFLQNLPKSIKIHKNLPQITKISKKKKKNTLPTCRPKALAFWFCGAAAT